MPTPMQRPDDSFVEGGGVSVLGRCDQATKGTRWMTWRQEAMKDVGACDKPREAGNQAVILGSPNGETHPPCADIHA